MQIVDEGFTKISRKRARAPGENGKKGGRAPQANAYCERLVGTIRRECLDFLIPLSEKHLRTILKVWVPISKARAYLPSYACSIMQSVMELECDGAYDSLDAVLFCVPCDTLRCISQIWTGKAPSITFTHPQNRRIEAANDFLAAEYDLVRSKLEKAQDKDQR